MQTNDLCLIRLFQKEMFDHLTEKTHELLAIVILETI